MLIANVLLLSACPSDDGGDDEIGEAGTGDSGEGTDTGEPIDPLEGGGDEPPGMPDPEASWPASTSLGNGLVHDTRASISVLEYDEDFLNATLAAEGVPWSGFVESFEVMLEGGFRPAQVRAEVTVVPAVSNTFSLEIRDRTLYVSDDDANYRTEIETYLFPTVMNEADGADDLSSSDHAMLGARPTSIETFAVNVSGSPVSVGFSLAWIYDDSGIPWTVITGETEANFLSEVATLKTAGYRPISISSRLRSGISEYAGIFVQDGVPTSDWSISLGLTPASVEAEVADKWDDGFYPFLGTSEQGSWTKYNMLWVKRPPGLAIQARFNMTSATLDAEDAIWRSQGYHRQSFDRYDSHGSYRYAAIWVKHAPYMRWQGTPYDPMDPYEMFHDQIMQVMTLDGQMSQGDWFRPSGTLHVFEGDDLVINRAYTYAPATYPDTPLNAPMKLASVSKGITAAAVVREMDEQSLPLTTAYTTAAGIVGEPALDDVTVLDVLRNLGGFVEASPASYGDHSIIDASIFGDIPITGEEMFEYVVDGDNLVLGDAYWNFNTYDTSQTLGTMLYSNVGYTMVGEVVRVLSGDPYEAYVIDNLLTPLNLDQEIYADPGHRVYERGPTQAGRAAYLIMDGHPYAGNPSAVIFDATSLSSIASTFVDGISWWHNAGPVDSVAPGVPSVGRYSGKAYIGGAPLAAGGWFGDGESLGLLLYALSQSSFLMPTAVANQLWAPQWWNLDHENGVGWSYGLGCYVRGNWVAWAGGATGSMATVLHNRIHDVTVVVLTNVHGNGLSEYMNPLMDSPLSTWGGSPIGAVFPCQDELGTPEDECDTLTADVPY